MINVLFVDADNGSRSRMAAAFLSRFGAAQFTAYSAGARAGYGNAYAEEVMQEINFDITRVNSRDVQHYFRQGYSIHYIIILCRENELKQCDLLPPSLIRLHWMFEDPVKFEGTEETILEQYRNQRDMIKKVVKQFVKEIQRGRFHLIADLNFEPAGR